VKRALLLGAGLVSRPLVRHLLGCDDVVLTVADRDAAKASDAIGRHPRGRAATVAAADAPSLDALVRDCDLVVSLLPATEHVAVARAALAHRVPMITTSYVSAEMRELDGEARAAGVLLLNEIGLDPGLDHMSAMRAIRHLAAAGHKLVSFKSCCGGLPAPDANTNPWGYKFSWSPRGVLMAGRNPARWLEDGRVVEVDGAGLFHRVAPYDVPGVGTFEVYPNRDAIAYVATYGLEGVLTMFRGTLRYPGWCETLGAVSRLGLLDVTERGWRTGTTCREFMEAFAADGGGPVRARVAERAGLDPSGAVIGRLEWLGLFGSEPIGVTRGAPIDVLCARMQAAMGYAAGERDMIVLRHEFGTIGPDGREAATVSTLTSFGDPRGDSAMARTVALPAAVAARLLLDGKIGVTGVRIPVDPEIYDPVLAALVPMGIVFEERRITP
jgi:saccharopine dehydrogenase-like NADP-dependent oxidoreductase